MAYNPGVSNPFGFVVTPWVKKLLIANGVAFLLTAVIPGLREQLIFIPALIFPRFWTIATYMFVHVGLFHLLFNMLALFFFGPPLEERWGSRTFVRFYFLAGAGGALLSLLFPNQAIAGASGAVYGIMVAFAMYWPENPIYIWGILPVKAKWLVAFLVGLSTFYAISGGQAGTAHLAHLGGAIAAFAYLRSPWAPSEWGNSYGRPKKRRRPRTWNVLAGLSRADETARESAEEQKPTVNAAARREEAHRTLDEVDRILDKISADGISSLTEEERTQLEDASKRFRSN